AAPRIVSVGPRPATCHDDQVTSYRLAVDDVGGWPDIERARVRAWTAGDDVVATDAVGAEDRVGTLSTHQRVCAGVAGDDIGTGATLDDLQVGEQEVSLARLAVVADVVQAQRQHRPRTEVVAGAVVHRVNPRPTGVVVAAVLLDRGEERVVSVPTVDNVI